MVLVVQAAQGRDKEFPHIGLVRQQQQALGLPGVVKVDMESAPALTYTQEYAPSLVHLDKEGASELAVRCARAVANPQAYKEVFAPPKP